MNALVVGPWERYSAGLNVSGCDDVDSSAGGVAEVCSFVSYKRRTKIKRELND